MHSFFHDALNSFLQGINVFDHTNDMVSRANNQMTQSDGLVAQEEEKDIGLFYQG